MTSLEIKWQDNPMGGTELEVKLDGKAILNSTSTFSSGRYPHGKVEEARAFALKAIQEAKFEDAKPNPTKKVNV